MLVMIAPRSSASHRRRNVDGVILFTRSESTVQEEHEGPAAGSTSVRQIAGDSSPGPRTFKPNSQGPRKAGIERARRLLCDHPHDDVKVCDSMTRSG
jgi:hypothetical protein